MYILAIESSCDDTSVALVEITDEKIKILAEKTASQIEIHKKYGGVVPEIAGRMHAEKILPVIEEVMKNQDKPDVIAVTSGPGLITGLLVGVEAAKSLSLLWDVPLIGVNHIEGHIYSTLIPNEARPRWAEEESFEENKKQNTIDKCDPTDSNSERSLVVPITSGLTRDKLTYPILALVASGGHSEIILSTKEGHYEKIGGTRDDAAGECFDKVAKLLGFDYPGGPKISKFAEEGNPTAIQFPRPMHDSNDFDFSFSGLKTAALYWLRDNKLSAMNVSAMSLPSGISGVQKQETTIHDFCASFEQAIVDLLVGKTLKAVEKFQPKTVILAGGVSANKKLRKTLGDSIEKYDKSITYHLSPITYAMDNATMIAVAAYHHAKKKEFVNWKDLKADPNWHIYHQS